MAEIAAGQPFYESTWLAAGGILLLSAIVSLMLMFLMMAMLRMDHQIRRHPEFHKRITVGVVLFFLFFLFVLAGLPEQFGAPGPKPPPQSVTQQRLAQDEEALDKGVLTYPPPPTLKADLTTTLAVTVTDLGKHPADLIAAHDYSQETGMVVYPRNIPTGGIVGLHLTCTANVYCQALSSTRQAIVGTGTSQSWSWNLTALHPGPTLVMITATTYEGTTEIVLHEEVIPIRINVENGPWWATIDDLWHSMMNFADTTAGLITTIGGAVAVIAGGIGWIRRTRSKKARPAPGRGAQPETDNGPES